MGGGGSDQRAKILCQICASLIVTSWHLVAQHATSVTASLIKIRVNKLLPALGAGGRKFKSSRPDHLKQGFMAICRKPLFLSVPIKLACPMFQQD